MMRALTLQEARNVCGGGSQLGQSLVTCENVVGTLTTANIDVALGVGTALSGGGALAGAVVSFGADATGLPGALGNSFANWACSPSSPDMSFQNSVGGMDVDGSNVLERSSLDTGCC